MKNIKKNPTDIGKEVIENTNPKDVVDFGDLPSRAVPEMGKQAFANMIEQEKME
jgi:hypothetical protein